MFAITIIDIFGTFSKIHLGIQVGEELLSSW